MPQLFDCCPTLSQHLAPEPIGGLARKLTEAKLAGLEKDLRQQLQQANAELKELGKKASPCLPAIRHLVLLCLDWPPKGVTITRPTSLALQPLCTVAATAKVPEVQIARSALPLDVVGRFYGNRPDLIH